jgi:hypothetical protein
MNITIVVIQAPKNFILNEAGVSEQKISKTTSKSRIGKLVI